jgi:hypothetical protein
LRLPEALDRPIELYTAINKPHELKKWQAERAKYPRARQFNLYAELIAFVGHPDPTIKGDSPPLYAATCRWLLREPQAVLESWSHALAVGGRPTGLSPRRTL